ncbi:MAG: TIGR02996 domain-containing protein, partial [Myxococcales bacterium]|nr:TIGR02996 domain-containing protein [Myxococcales bacterium]
IDGARALVEREELAAALAALLAMWRGARAASLTEAIVALGAKVAERDAARAVHDELAQGNKPARLETFVRLASGAPTDAAQAATTLGALCEALDRDNGRNLRTQVEALESWPEDPRLALALAPLVTSPTMNDAHAWQGVFNLLRRHGDALALQELEVAADAFGSALRVPVRSRAELAPTISHLRGVLINTPALDDGARAALSRLRDAVSAAGGRSGEGAARRGGGAADERSPEALLAAIYEQPDDDALRRVYADVLSELGDPRGELCAIQLADAPSAAQRKRERELCTAHGRAWLGPLDAVALKQGLEFRRGFPSALRTTGKKLAGARAALAAQEWSTIERLEITDSLMLPEALVRDAPLRSLRVASGLPGDIAAAIFASPTPWRLYELGAALHFDIWEDDDDDERQEAERGRAAVREARGVPALRRLIVERGGGAIERWAWLLESAKLMKQLEFLQLGVSNDAVAGALRYLESHPGLPRVELLETFRSWQLAYEDGALHVTYGGGYAVDDETADKLAQLLAQLPGAVRQLRSLTVELPARAKVSESVLARVREAAIGLGAAQSSLP